MSKILEINLKPQLNSQDLSVDAKLDWTELAKSFEDFPENMCDRFELVATIYDEGACVEKVEIDIQEHLQECKNCQQSLLEYRAMSKQFEQRRHIEIEISAAEIEQSFEKFMDLYGDELFAQQEDLDQVEQLDRKSLLSVEVDSSSVEDMQERVKLASALMSATTSIGSNQEPGLPGELKVGPMNKKTSRIAIAFGLLSAAALLFAYGPALIEAPIHEDEFPQQSSQVDSEQKQVQDQSQVSWVIPFAQYQGQALPATSLHTPLTLVSLNAKQTQDGPISVQFEIKDQEKLSHVDLTLTQISPAQKTILQERLKDTKVFSVSDKQGIKKSVQVRFQALGNLQTAEYLLEENYIQWAYSGEEARSLLERVIEAHLLQN
jgi:hypothetical protein